MQKQNIDISTSSMCGMYRLFKKQLNFENYLLHSNYRDIISLSKLRCANSKFPINIHVYAYDSDVCILCNLNVCGDESRPTRITQTWSQVCQVRVVRPLKSYCVTAEHVDTPNLS